MQAIKLKKLDGKEWDERRKNRVELAQCGGLDALQQLLNQYWTWHFDESLAGIARLLLATDLSIANAISHAASRSGNAAMLRALARRSSCEREIEKVCAIGSLSGPTTVARVCSCPILVKRA